jgi:hypothetical protein
MIIRTEIMLHALAKMRWEVTTHLLLVGRMEGIIE